CALPIWSCRAALVLRIPRAGTGTVRPRVRRSTRTRRGPMVARQETRFRSIFRPLSPEILTKPPSRSGVAEQGPGGLRWMMLLRSPGLSETAGCDHPAADHVLDPHRQPERPTVHAVYRP